MSNTKPNLLQMRGEFNIGGLHVYAGKQLEPQQVMVLPHDHPQPHMMVLHHVPLHECPHCKGSLPVANYKVSVRGTDGMMHELELGPYGFVYVRAGAEHSVEQTTPGALGGFSCIFDRYDEQGRLMPDPKRTPEPGVTYG